MIYLPVLLLILSQNALNSYSQSSNIGKLLIIVFLFHLSPSAPVGELEVFFDLILSHGNSELTEVTHQII